MSQEYYTWSGRFKEGIEDILLEFSESISFDYHLFEADIKGNLAHTWGLYQIGILSQEEWEKVSKALEEIRQEFNQSSSPEDFFSTEKEDIHMNIEYLLSQKVGSLAYKIHTGRSRNDQVVTDLKILLRQWVQEMIELIKKLQQEILKKAQEYQDIIFCAYTHMQQGQPLYLAHHLLAYLEMLARDIQRFQFNDTILDQLPLGSGACVGTSFALPRQQIAQRLGFSKITKNSLDATSDRDFLSDYLYSITMLGIHLSRMAQEWVLWSGKEYNFLSIGDAFCTGSSMMPNKKNPDGAELIRGNVASQISDLMSLLILTKGMSLGYHRDFQDDKRRLFEAQKRTFMSLSLCIKMVSSFKFHQIAPKQLLSGHCYATDIAEYLVEKGCPFRQAHQISGQIVSTCEEQGVLFCQYLTKYSLKDINQQFCEQNAYFQEDIFQIIPAMESLNDDTQLLKFLKCSIDKKVILGGTASINIQHVIKEWKETLS